MIYGFFRSERLVKGNAIADDSHTNLIVDKVVVTAASISPDRGRPVSSVTARSQRNRYGQRLRHRFEMLVSQLRRYRVRLSACGGLGQGNEHRVLVSARSQWQAHHGSADLFSLEDRRFNGCTTAAQHLVCLEWSHATDSNMDTFLANLGIASTCALVGPRAAPPGVLSLRHVIPVPTRGSSLPRLGSRARWPGDRRCGELLHHPARTGSAEAVLDLTNQVVSNLELPDLLHGPAAFVASCAAILRAVMLADAEGTHLPAYTRSTIPTAAPTEGALVPRGRRRPAIRLRAGGRWW